MCAPTQHRYEWCYLVGFVHPASGRAVFHLASTVSIPLFEMELAAFARQVGASSREQIVLVLDRAGWYTSAHLRVPDHVHLQFLPAYSSELQPAEHLWPLTNTALANRHYATIDDLEDAHATRCVVLQDRPDLIRSTTRVHWWPQRIAKRHVQRRNKYEIAMPAERCVRHAYQAWYLLGSVSALLRTLRFSDLRRLPRESAGW